MNIIKNKAEFLRVILVYAMILLIMIVTSKIMAVTGLDLSMLARSTILYIPMIAITLIYTFIKGDKFAKSFGFEKIKISTVLWTVLLTVVTMPMGFFANVLSQLFVPNVVLQSMDDMMTNSVAMILLVGAVLAPICEEIVMRGFFHNRFAKLIPFGAAACLSGFLFGVLHLNLNQFCYAWVLGVIFAYVNRASGSIFTSMIMHMVYNAYGMLSSIAAYSVLEASGVDIAEAAEAGRTSTGAMIIPIVVFGILSVGSFFLTRKIIQVIARNEGNDIKSTEREIVAE